MIGAKVLLLDYMADSSNELDWFNGHFEKCDEVMLRLWLRDSAAAVDQVCVSGVKDLWAFSFTQTDIWFVA